MWKGKSDNTTLDTRKTNIETRYYIYMEERWVGGRGRIKCLHTICWGKIIADSAQLTRDKNVKEEVVGGRTDESWFICSSTELKKNKENFID